MSSPRYNVLHVITRLELGGAQQNTLFCTARHDRERFNVGLVAGRGGALDTEALGIADANVELLDELTHPIAPWWDLRALLRLRRHLREQRIDLVHTHSSKAGILGRIAAWLSGVPVIVHTVHGWSFNETQPSWQRSGHVALERAVAPLTDALIVVAARHRESGLEQGIGRPEQYRVVRSGIDREAYARTERTRSRVRLELGYRDDDVVVGTVACLKPQKAPLDFVDAAARASVADPRLRFVMVGDGDLRAAVERRVAEHGLGDRLRVLGWRRDVPELLGAMDLFLLTSRFEGLPRAVLQAMAAGVPVVATAVDGTPEVVLHEQTGLLVPPGQPAAAAAAVLRLAAEPQRARALAAAARRLLSEAFDIHAMVGTLDRLYLDLLHAKGR